jgi:putative FmdB family regulatory protein
MQRMPTYEYECRRCGSIVEVYQSITENALKRLPEPCPKCRERTPARRRIGTGGGVIFKGSGFYQTDYRSESYKQAAKSESEAAAPPKTETKTDTAKPESKPVSETPAKPAKGRKAKT